MVSTEEAVGGQAQPERRFVIEITIRVLLPRVGVEITEVIRVPCRIGHAESLSGPRKIEPKAAVRQTIDDTLQSSTP